MADARTTSNSSVNKERLTQWIVTLAVITYGAPVIFINFVFWIYGTSDPTIRGIDWFLTFASTSTSTLNQFQNALLPLLTAWSAFAFKDKLSSRFTGFLSLLLFVLIAASIYMHTTLQTASVMNDFQGSAEYNMLSGAGAYFDRIQGMLLTYLLLLLGLKGAQAASHGG